MFHVLKKLYTTEMPLRRVHDWFYFRTVLWTKYTNSFKKRILKGENEENSEIKIDFL